MNVLIVANAFPKFSETFVRDHAVGLMKKGLDVSFLVNEIDDNERRALDGLESFNLLERTTTLNRLLPKSMFFKLVKAVSRTRFFRHDKRAMAFKSFVTSSLKKGLSKTIHNVFILDYIKKNNIDIVHCHYGNNGERMIFLKDYGLILFTTFHGYDIREGIEHERQIYKNLLQSGIPVISISPFNKKSLRSIGFKNSCILNIANGVDTEFFKGNQIKIKSSKLKIISVARLSPEKGLDIAIEALRLLLSEIPKIDLEYTIVGEGKSRKQLESLISNLKLDGVVRLIGFKTSQETRDLLLDSDLFILPSRAEASPTVILEAQSMGLPIIATDVGSVRNMVTKGVIVKPDSVLDLKKGFENMLKKRKEWVDMGEKGRKYVVENHSLETQIEAIIEAYKNYK